MKRCIEGTGLCRWVRMSTTFCSWQAGDRKIDAAVPDQGSRPPSSVVRESRFSPAAFVIYSGPEWTGRYVMLPNSSLYSSVAFGQK